MAAGALLARGCIKLQRPLASSLRASGPFHMIGDSNDQSAQSPDSPWQRAALPRGAYAIEPSTRACALLGRRRNMAGEYGFAAQAQATRERNLKSTESKSKAVGGVTRRKQNLHPGPLVKMKAAALRVHMAIDSYRNCGESMIPGPSYFLGGAKPNPRLQSVSPQRSTTKAKPKPI